MSVARNVCTQKIKHRKQNTEKQTQKMSSFGSSSLPAFPPELDDPDETVAESATGGLVFTNKEEIEAQRVGIALHIIELN